jgi:hypothetical protein
MSLGAGDPLLALCVRDRDGRYGRVVVSRVPSALNPSAEEIGAHRMAGGLPPDAHGVTDPKAIGMTLDVVDLLLRAFAHAPINGGVSRPGERCKREEHRHCREEDGRKQVRVKPLD